MKRRACALALVCLAVAVVVAGLPPSFDARTEWPLCISPIADAPAASAATPYAVALTMSDRLCVYRSGQAMPLSEAQLAACFTGALIDTWTYINDKGLISAQCYGTQHGCTSRCQVGMWAPVRFSSVEIVLEAYGMMALLGSTGPFTAVLNVSSSWLTYSHGVYVCNAAPSIGITSVRVLGWVNATGTSPMGAWVAAPSYGTGWGNDGTVLLDMASCALEGVAGFFS